MKTKGIAGLLLAWLGWVAAAQGRGPQRPAFDSVATRAAHVYYWAHQDAPRDSSRRHLQAGLALARRAGDGYGEVGYLNDLGQLAATSGRYAEAQQLLGQALAQLRRGRHYRWLWVTALNLGSLATEQGDHRRAVGWYEQALAATARYRPVPSTAEADALACLITAYGELRQRGATARVARRALALTRRQHDAYGEALAACSWAGELNDFGAPDSAEALLRPALATLRTLHAPPHDLAGAEALLALAHAGQRHWPALLAAAPSARRGLRQAQNVEGEIELLDRVAAGQQALGLPVAYATLRRVLALKDSLRTRQRDREVLRLQVQFDLAGQQARIRALEQTRRIARLQAARQQARSQALAVAAAVALAVALAVGLLLALVLRQRRRLQASETQLQAANRTKDQLIRLVGHDLRAPLASFQQLVPLLHDVIEQPERRQAHQLIGTLDAGAQHLGGLVDNLFQWARAQGGQLVNHPERLAADLVLGSTAALYAPGAQLKGIALHTEAPPGLGVSADLGLLSTVLRNLAGNALKFTPGGGTVGLAARPVPGPAGAPPQVEFSVTDTGPGLAPLPLAQLLAADRLPSTPGTLHEPGTGLGLPLCARFVQLMGGELHLGPGPAGRGTRAWFRLAGA